MGEFVAVKYLGRQAYAPIWQQQKLFTHNRTEATQDEIWLLEHLPVYTQGQAGKAEHILCAGDIPVVQSDRGGQVTYHGPGQLIVYFLIDLQRKKINIRRFIDI
ncbi:MAG TPA: lipoyl(octanoyl) transferase LipB, partial [Gammaproteobacteria bacterium]|nr:lipoyl(octanoyl) transferase LipB [Gammaproteobacteria bacterium]